MHELDPPNTPSRQLLSILRHAAAASQGGSGFALEVAAIRHGGNWLLEDVGGEFGAPQFFVHELAYLHS